MSTAVIDVGSGSVRMLLDGKKQTIMTKLGEGLSATGRLCKAAIERTIAVVKDYVRQARGADKVYVFATEAVRAAENRTEFLRAVESECGVSVEVISGSEEAEIALLGASATGDATVVDIGGASVEIVSGDGSRLVYVRSLPLGMVRLTEQSGGDPELLRAYAARGIARFGDVSLRSELMGVGGTLTSLAAMKLGLQTYDGEKVNGTHLTASDVSDLCGRVLACKGDTGRIKAEFPVLPDMRCGLITAGVIFVSELLAYLSASSITISESDNLDGFLRYKRQMTAPKASD